MKIAYVYDNVYPYYVGGIEKRIWEIGRRLSQKGHDVHWYCMKYWDGNDVINKDGIWLHGVCPPKPLFSNGRRSIKEAIYFARKVFGPLRKENFDIIEPQNFPYFPIFSAKASSFLKTSKLIVTWHEVWDTYWYDYLGRIGFCGLIVERFAAQSSGRMIAVSELTKNSLLRIGLQNKIIKLIPNGVSYSSIKNVTKVKETTDVIFAGRLIKEKGVHILIEAIGILNQMKPDIRCLIIGNGPEKEELYELVAKKELHNNIKFKGFLENFNSLIAYMKSSKAFVLPSKREGFGIVAIEANACGIPVITTNHPQNAAKDLIIKNKNGFLFDMTPEDLAVKIFQAINRYDWSKKCQDHALKYDWNRVAEQVENYYINELR